MRLVVIRVTRNGRLDVQTGQVAMPHEYKTP